MIRFLILARVHVWSLLKEEAILIRFVTYTDKRNITGVCEASGMNWNCEVKY